MRKKTSEPISSVGEVIWRNARWLLRLTVLVFFSVSVLAACAPQTEEEQIAAVNRRIRPEGHLTKTHLYIHWPAVYTQPTQHTHWQEPGGKEIVPALTLKIPFEYLGQGAFPIPFVSKEEREALRSNYSYRINLALSISRNQIISVFLGMQHPGAKPFVPMTPYKTDPPDVADRKFENIIRSYAVHINRDYWHATPLDQRIPGQDPYNRPPESSCRADLPDTYCDAYFSVKGRQAEMQGVGESLESYYKYQDRQKHPQKYLQPAEPKPQLPPDGLPRWHEKVDPTQALINSFILPENSPEVQAIFGRKIAEHPYLN